MFDLGKYTKKSVELKFPNGDMISVKPLLKKDVELFIATATKGSKNDIKTKEMDEMLVNILNKNEEGKIIDKNVLNELQINEYRGLIEFIKTLIKEDAKKHHSQSQMMK